MDPGLLTCCKYVYSATWSDVKEMFMFSQKEAACKQVVVWLTEKRAENLKAFITKCHDE